MIEVMGAIYSILNMENGKIYVGQSIEHEKRFAQHKSDLNGGYHHNSHLQNAWNKYGSNSFEFNVLEFCDDEEMNDNESWWINYFDSTHRDKGYNFESGGNSQYFVSDDTRRKMSENHADVRGENNPFYGKKHSQETIKKLREKQLGKKQPLTYKINNSKANNTIGYFRVTTQPSKTSKQGFLYVYKYYDDDGKRKSITSIDLSKLEKKVIEKGLIWEKFE